MDLTQIKPNIESEIDRLWKKVSQIDKAVIDKHDFEPIIFETLRKCCDRVIQWYYSPNNKIYVQEIIEDLPKYNLPLVEGLAQCIIANTAEIAYGILEEYHVVWKFESGFFYIPTRPIQMDLDCIRDFILYFAETESQFKPLFDAPLDMKSITKIKSLSYSGYYFSLENPPVCIEGTPSHILSIEDMNAPELIEMENLDEINEKSNDKVSFATIQTLLDPQKIDRMCEILQAIKTLSNTSGETQIPVSEYLKKIREFADLAKNILSLG